jgi:valyl-tRNA synthetase
VISRQRVFATPIPVWYCKNCGELILAEEEWVPIDPKLENPRVDKCPKCGSREFIPERDVFDTWMDSSITCAVHAGWPDREDWKRLFPADVHPSGIDIIRTWAYYLMVRHLALFSETPYKSCLINGMVLGSDGRKMSKSLKNYVAAPEVLGKYGSDATRQWAAGGGATGSDIPFRWPDVEYGRRFLVKLWNVSSFANKLLSDYKPVNAEAVALEPLDKWILSKAENLTQKVTEAFEKCQFNIAVEEIRNFTWHVFCDYYVEVIKDKLYNPDVYGSGKKLAAQYTLYEVLYRVLQLLAPMTSHLTEEIYQGFESLQISPWPKYNPELENEAVEKNGDFIMAIISAVRQDKAEKKLSLNAPSKTMDIYVGSEENANLINSVREDLAGTLKIANIRVHPEKRGDGRQISPYDFYFQIEY